MYDASIGSLLTLKLKKMHVICASAAHQHASHPKDEHIHKVWCAKLESAAFKSSAIRHPTQQTCRKTLSPQKDRLQHGVSFTYSQIS